MTSRRYENFDLLLEAAGDGTYRSRVAASPVGAGATATFTMPFDGTALENLLLKLDPGRSQMRRASADPRPKASVELGGALFDAVFGEEVLLAWSRSQDATREAGEGLRLRLQLTDAPEIAGLPWELLYDRRTGSYPAQSERTPLVRYLEVPQPPRPLTVDGPLRVLVVLSSPTDLPELDVEAEWRRMQDMLASRVAAGAVQLDRLPAPTTTELAAWLRATRSMCCTSSATATTTRTSRRASSTSATSTAAVSRFPPASSVPTSTTTTRCGWSSSTPASPDGSAPRTRSAAWPSAWSSRTARRWSPCSSPSATARRPSSPASSMRPSRTVCRSTRP